MKFLIKVNPISIVWSKKASLEGHTTLWRHSYDVICGGREDHYHIYCSTFFMIRKSTALLYKILEIPVAHQPQSLEKSSLPFQNKMSKKTKLKEKVDVICRIFLLIVVSKNRRCIWLCCSSIGSIYDSYFTLFRQPNSV